MNIRHASFGYGEGKLGSLLVVQGSCTTKEEAARFPEVSLLIPLDTSLIVVDIKTELRLANHDVVDGMRLLADELNKRAYAPQILWIVGGNIRMMLNVLQLADRFQLRSSREEIPELPKPKEPPPVPPLPEPDLDRF